MSKINPKNRLFKHKIDSGILKNRRLLAEGKHDKAIRQYRHYGILRLLIAVVACVLLSKRFIYDIHSYMSTTNIVYAVRAMMLGGLIAIGIWQMLVGFKSAVHPEKDKTYQRHYLGMVAAVSRNTGYPDKPYIPSEWEIPFTDYTEEAVANLLKLVDGWGGEQHLLFMQFQELQEALLCFFGTRPYLQSV